MTQKLSLALRCDLLKRRPQSVCGIPAPGHMSHLPTPKSPPAGHSRIVYSCTGTVAIQADRLIGQAAIPESGLGTPFPGALLGKNASRPKRCSVWGLLRCYFMVRLTRYNTAAEYIQSGEPDFRLLHLRWVIEPLLPKVPGLHVFCCWSVSIRGLARCFCMASNGLFGSSMMRSSTQSTCCHFQPVGGSA